MCPLTLKSVDNESLERKKKSLGLWYAIKLQLNLQTVQSVIRNNNLIYSIHCMFNHLYHLPKTTPIIRCMSKLLTSRDFCTDILKTKTFLSCASLSAALDYHTVRGGYGEDFFSQREMRGGKKKTRKKQKRSEVQLQSLMSSKDRACSLLMTSHLKIRGFFWEKKNSLKNSDLHDHTSYNSGF